MGGAWCEHNDYPETCPPSVDVLMGPIIDALANGPKRYGDVRAEVGAPVDLFDEAVGNLIQWKAVTATYGPGIVLVLGPHAGGCGAGRPRVACDDTERVRALSAG